MLRTVAVLFLLLGLATATPVVCLCAPPLAPETVVLRLREPAEGPSYQQRDGATVGAVFGYGHASSAGDPALDTASLISASMAAVAASLVATAAGLPSSAPWRLPRPLGVSRTVRPTFPAPAGLAWSPAVPPPR